jgi:hypothetical protein
LRKHDDEASSSNAEKPQNASLVQARWRFQGLKSCVYGAGLRRNCLNKINNTSNFQKDSPSSAIRNPGGKCTHIARVLCFLQLVLSANLHIWECSAHTRILTQFPKFARMFCYSLLLWWTWNMLKALGMQRRYFHGINDLKLLGWSVKDLTTNNIDVAKYKQAMFEVECCFALYLKPWLKISEFYVGCKNSEMAL